MYDFQLLVALGAALVVFGLVLMRYNTEPYWRIIYDGNCFSPFRLERKAWVGWTCVGGFETKETALEAYNKAKDICYLYSSEPSDSNEAA